MYHELSYVFLSYVIMILARSNWSMEMSPDCDVKGCRICFATDCKLYQITAYKKLYKAYETLTGLSIKNGDILPHYLCTECARRLLNCARFRSTSLEAHSILLDNVKNHGSITLEILRTVRGTLTTNQMEYDNQTDHDLEIELTEKQNLYNAELDGVRHFPVESINVNGIKVEPDDDDDDNDSEHRSKEHMVYISIEPSNAVTDEKSIVVKQETPNNVDIYSDNLPKEIAVKVKIEKDDLSQDLHVAEDISNDDVVHISWQEVGGAVNNVNYVISQDGANEKTTNDDMGHGDAFDDEDYASNDSLPLAKARQAARLKTGTQALLEEPSDSDQAKVDTHRRSNDSGYLTYYRLSCELCPFKTNNELRWKCHLQAHEATESYNCNICNYITTSKNRLLCHYKVHSGDKPYSCDLCARVFSKKHNFDVHYRTHYTVKPYSCGVCTKTFTEKRILEDHERTHSGEKPFSCHVCSKSFTQRSTLRKHLHVHSERKPYTCHLCNKTFTEKTYVQIHMRVHSGEKPYSCDICNKVFNRKHHLTKHMSRHTGDRPHACEVCNKAFVDTSSLRTHTRLHTDEKPFACEFCNKTFKTKGNAKSHMQRHLKNE